MDLPQLFLGPMLRPRVVHRLPGRLRVHLPALKHLPENNAQLLDVIEAVLAAPLEIESARACSATGNLLLTYDPARVADEQVVRYM